MQRLDADKTIELLDRMGRLISSKAHTSGLLPVHWETLRYLQRANRFSRTSAALTAFLGSTKGTVSQTVKALEGKGLVSNESDPKDRRKNVLALTTLAEQLLSSDPLLDLVETIEALPGSQRAGLNAGLRRLLTTQLTKQGRRPFGMCRDCAHFSAEHSAGAPHYCLLLKEPLTASDSKAICQEQTPRQAAAG